MTPEEIETERAALIAELDNSEGPLTEDQQERMGAIIAAQLSVPLEPWEQAFRESLDNIVLLQTEPLPPGLDIRVRDDRSDLIDVLSRGRVIGAVSRSALAARTAEITRERAAAAQRHN